MALTLTPEDGTIVSGANSYATLAQIRSYCAQRGTVLPADDDAVTALATQALDYLESFEPRMKGSRAAPLLQNLAWPRQNVWLYTSRLYGDAPLPITTIPAQLITTQCFLAGVAATYDLNPIQDTRAVIEETVGPLITKYDPRFGAAVRPIIPQLDAMLAPLLKRASPLTTVRV